MHPIFTFSMANLRAKEAPDDALLQAGGALQGGWLVTTSCQTNLTYFHLLTGSLTLDTSLSLRSSLQRNLLTVL